MTDERTPILETRKLGITFGGLVAVSDFNIKVFKGELVGRHWKCFAQFSDRGRNGFWLIVVQENTILV